MTQLVFFLEEPSAKEMLKGILPKLLPDNVTAQYVVFEGKQDLEKRLPMRLKAWQQPNAKFIIMRDQDGGNCITIKQNLADKCAASGKPDVLVRIACHELETFYLGDLNAVSLSIGPAAIVKSQNKAKYRDPDRLANPSEELKKLAPTYQKVSGSRAIGPLLDIHNNKSKSFIALVSGVMRLLGDSV